MVVALGRSHGHHRAVLVTVTGQVSRPPLGRTQWPLTFDFCCQGVNSTHHVVVGRYRSITGPYVDCTGTSLLAGGGSAFLDARAPCAGRAASPSAVTSSPSTTTTRLMPVHPPGPGSPDVGGRLAGARQRQDLPGPGQRRVAAQPGSAPPATTADLVKIDARRRGHATLEWLWTPVSPTPTGCTSGFATAVHRAAAS